MERTASLLSVWEQGRTCSLLQRVVLLIAAGQAAQETDPAALWRLPVGERDRRLLALQRRWFGDPMNAQGYCPACDEHLEFALDAAVLGAPGTVAQPATATCRSGDYEVDVHFPTSEDLAAVAGLPETEARRLLQDRCLRGARASGQPVSLETLPKEVVEGVFREMAERDPHGDIVIGVRCPQCNQHWDAPLDAGTFLWSELDAWAQRTLYDVHILALTYGWSESDILAMSPSRCRHYLEMARNG